MTDIQNSCIQPWLDYPYSQGSFTPRCHDPYPLYGAPPDSCMAVCNTSSLLGWSNNLLTCGYWANLAALSAQNAGSLSHGPPLQELKKCNEVGLNASDTAYVKASQDAISSRLNGIGKSTRALMYQIDTSYYEPCSRLTLFSSSTTVHTCIDAICAPRTLNPDLGGVGVSLSRHRRQL